MSKVQDPWESGPQYPPWFEDPAEYIPERPGIIPDMTPKDRKTRKIGAVAAALLLSAGSAAAYIELSGSPSRQTIARRQQRQRREFILGAVSAAAKGDFGYCQEHAEPLPPQKYHRRTVIDINNQLRRQLKEPPLRESRLLDEYAQQVASDVAGKPALFKNLNSIPRSKIEIKIIDSANWKDVRTQAEEYKSGQTVQAAACLADSADYLKDLKASDDIGVGAAAQADKSYLIVTYGIRNSS